MRTMLILDEASVAAHRGVTFRVNPATKHPANPLLTPGQPHEWDSLCVSWPGQVIYSPRDGRFRCWYAGMDAVQSPGRTWHTGYAESHDGIEWVKPEIGHAEFLGKKTNQIKPKWDPSFLSTAFENPDPSAPESRRFGSYWMESRFEDPSAPDWQKSLWAKALAWSPDGVEWTRVGQAYLERRREPLLDISQVLHDPSDPDPAFRWKAYGQVFVPREGWKWPGIRHVGLAHGADPTRVEDASPLVVLSPLEGVDEEIHFGEVQRFGDTYLMLFESDRFSQNPIHGDLRLAVSDDGRKFRRIHARSPLVSTGPRGTWDENLLVTNGTGMQEVGDEVYIYYFGCPMTYNSWPMQYAVSGERRGSAFAPVFMGLATLPRDRFCYVAGSGSVTTRPIEVTGDGLWLNADGDGLGVTARHESGTEARGALSRERRGGVYRRVQWEGAAPRGAVSVEVSLGWNDRLYSLGY